MHPLRYLAISAYAFGLSYLWNAVGPLVLPQLVERVVPSELVGTALGGVRFLGLFVAILVQPVAGHLSDRARTRFGKRKPFIAIGTFGDLIFLAGLLLAGDYLWLVAAYFGLQVASNLAQGAYQGFIPDLVPAAKRGTASGAKNLAEMGALIVTSLVVAALFGAGEWALAVGSIGGILLLALAVTWLGVHEDAPVGPSPQMSPSGEASDGGEAGGWRGLLALDRHRDGPFLWWLVSRFFMLLGVYFLQTYAFLFVKDVIRPPEPNAVVGPMLALIGVLITVSVQPAGWLADRLGHKPLLIVAGVLNALGVFLMIFASGRVLFRIGDFQVLDVLVFAAFVGVGTGIFLVTNWALGIGLAPPHLGGKYLGLSNLGTAGAGMAASIGGPIIDFLGYVPMFLVGTVTILVGTALLAKVRA